MRTANAANGERARARGARAQRSQTISGERRRAKARKNCWCARAETTRTKRILTTKGEQPRARQNNNKKSRDERKVERMRPR